MIRDCEDHGYFRDQYCPICGEEGKFIMSDFEVEKLGRSMAAILRHGKYDLNMDEQGFVSMKDIVAAIKERNIRMKWLRSHHLEAMVETDPKGRYQISGGDVRATYGHTIKLDLRLPTDDNPYELYYPTSEEEVNHLLEEGISPGDRAMVHLSKTFFDAVRAGQVHNDNPIILEIDVDACENAGYPIGKAAKTVYLCDFVPPECICVVTEEDIIDDVEDDDGEGSE